MWELDWWHQSSNLFIQPNWRDVNNFLSGYGSADGFLLCTRATGSNCHFDKFYTVGWAGVSQAGSRRWRTWTEIVTEIPSISLCFIYLFSSAFVYFPLCVYSVHTEPCYVSTIFDDHYSTKTFIEDPKMHDFALEIILEVEIFFLKICTPFFEGYFYVTIFVIEAISCVFLKQKFTSNTSRAVANDYFNNWLFYTFFWWLIG